MVYTSISLAREVHRQKRVPMYSHFANTQGQNLNSGFQTYIVAPQQPSTLHSPGLIQALLKH